MIKAVKKLARAKGFIIYEKPYYLNIWGFRANSQTPNSFDDEIHVFTNVRTLKRPKWAYWVFKCTTDPGTYWLKNPMNPQGTAILNPGQYVDSHALGLHRGKYKALVQRGVVSVTRDYNRNAILDFNNGKVVRGLYGINIHRASQVGSTIKVDKYSAGCQVFKNAKDFDFFIKLCELHRQKHANKFTYTLVDKRMEYRQNLKAVTIAGAIIGLLVGGYFLVNSDEHEQTRI
jgi:hypothetical protein